MEGAGTSLRVQKNNVLLSVCADGHGCRARLLCLHRLGSPGLNQSIRRRRQRRLTGPWTRCRYCLSASTNHSRFILHILTEDSGPQMCRLQKLQEFVCVYRAQSTKLLMINQSCLLWSGFLMMQPSLFFKYQESHVLHLDTFACQKGLNSTNT